MYLKAVKNISKLPKKIVTKGLYLPLLHKNITARTAVNSENKAEETESNEIQHNTVEKQ